jgi:hypothetical protein
VTEFHIPDGADCAVQLDPESVVAMTALLPTAQQSLVVGQDTLERSATPAGTVSGFQVLPPFVVASMAAPA